MKRISILTASNGKNLELAHRLQEKLEEMGALGEIIDLVSLDLPLYTSLEEKKGVPKNARALEVTLKDSHSVAFIAPEYNGSIPPVFNNAIAWVSRASKVWRDAFNGKTALIATHSGGGGAHVLMAMRHQLSFIGMNVIGRQLLTNFNKPLNEESLEECLIQLIK